MKALQMGIYDDLDTQTQPLLNLSKQCDNIWQPFEWKNHIFKDAFSSDASKFPAGRCRRNLYH